LRAPFRAPLRAPFFAAPRFAVALRPARRFAALFRAPRFAARFVAAPRAEALRPVFLFGLAAARLRFAAPLAVAMHHPWLTVAESTLHRRHHPPRPCVRLACSPPHCAVFPKPDFRSVRHPLARDVGRTVRKA
jgi:hypothetical protein